MRPFVRFGQPALDRLTLALTLPLVSSYSIIFFTLATAMYITGLDVQIWHRDIYGEPTPISLTALLRHYREKRHPQEDPHSPVLGISMRSRNTSSLLCIGTSGGCDCEQRKPEPLADIAEEEYEDIEGTPTRTDEGLGVVRGTARGSATGRGFRSGRVSPRTSGSISAAVSVPTLAEMRSQVVITLNRSSVRSL